MRLTDVPHDPLTTAHILGDLHRPRPEAVRTRLMKTTPRHWNKTHQCVEHSIDITTGRAPPNPEATTREPSHVRRRSGPCAAILTEANLDGGVEERVPGILAQSRNAGACAKHDVVRAPGFGVLSTLIRCWPKPRISVAKTR